jgi:lysophospholipase L1-like esterase
MMAVVLLAASLVTAGEIPIQNGDSVAFLGDSITQQGYSKPNGYIHLVMDGLARAGVAATPIPAGIGGHTSVNMLARLDGVLGRKPTWLVLNSGINDKGRRITTEAFDANIRAITARAMSAGVKVILMTPSVCDGENTDPTHPGTRQRQEYCEAFRKLAREKGLILVDLDRMFTGALAEIRANDPTSGLKISVDGCHLDGQGNQLIAAEILRTLGVSEQTIDAAKLTWNDYPHAKAMPAVSMNTYLNLLAAAQKRNLPIDEFASERLTKNASRHHFSSSQTRPLKVMQCWDDSLTTDIPLIAILKAHKAKATFNIIPRSTRSSFVVKKRNAREGTLFSFMPHGTQGGFEVQHFSTSEMPEIYKGFKVAAHCGFSLGDTPKAHASRQRVLTETMAMIRESFGQRDVGFVYPGGGYNELAMQAVKDAGYLYARTTQSATAPLPLDTPMCQPSSCHWSSDKFWDQYAYAKSQGGVFYFWGHSCELGDDPVLWKKFDSMIARISADPDAQWVDVVDVFKPGANTSTEQTPKLSITMKDGDKIAILSGQRFRNYAWGPSGHLRLLIDELSALGVRRSPLINLDGLTSAKMLARLDPDVIAKKPVHVLIIPGTADYKVATTAQMPAKSRENLSAIIEKLKAAGIASTLMTSYAVNGNASYGSNANSAGHNDAIRELARTHHIGLLDFAKAVDEARQTSPVPFDGNPIANCMVSQVLTGEILQLVGYPRENIPRRRKAWMDIPSVISFKPLVSVNTYTALQAAAKADGHPVEEQMKRILELD